MMTNDLSLNGRHVFISDLVIGSRQAGLRLVVGRPLTAVVISFKTSIVGVSSNALIRQF